MAGGSEIETDMQQAVRTRVLTHGEVPPGRYVRISIMDSGRGMDAATLERVFEPFFTTRPDGNGLGLATVREIVREHGGAMNVSSIPREGSCFEVWLPSVDASTSPAEIDAPALPLGRGETVLILDSDRTRLLRDEEMLAALGYEPVGFTRPSDAIAACRATPARFDAIVIGHLGVAAASLDLTQAFQDSAPGIAMVLVTASADEIAADALAAAGVVEVVHRPLVSTEIAAALRRGLATGARPALSS